MNEQEQFWKGQFGTEYQERQKASRVGSVESNIAFFSRILSRTTGVKRIIELGCGTGQNLDAISRLSPDIELMGVEINSAASMQVPVGYIFNQSIFDFEPPNYEHADLAFTKGVCIHVAPEDLPRLYAKLYESTQRYILVAEYFNPTPVALEYRGETGKLWKRDFAGELLDSYADLRLVDYGFAWRRDPNFPQDDITWHLMEKTR